MTLVIPKADFDTDGTSAPAWMEMVDSKGTPAKPIIRCKCGILCSIPLHHVHADGTVTASFFHADLRNAEGEVVHTGCGFHEFLKLDGYAGPEFPPGAR